MTIKIYEIYVDAYISDEHRTDQETYDKALEIYEGLHFLKLYTFDEQESEQPYQFIKNSRVLISAKQIEKLCDRKIPFRVVDILHVE